MSLEILNLVVTSLLVGLIWTIQMVHYPSFHFVDKNEFEKFELFHTTKITIIVLPLMLSELSICAWQQLYNSSKIHLLSLVITLLIWLITFLVSVPCHNKLKNGYSKPAIKKLISSNWFRTILWSLKLVVLVYSTTIDSL